jgi:hypothetical protein
MSDIPRKVRKGQVWRRRGVHGRKVFVYGAFGQFVNAREQTALKPKHYDLEKFREDHEFLARSVKEL